ncbi:MAG: hypothetical protein F6K19_45440 [Cyanothece sp. SIO1E1]|nr:hypothetical protein [Cyanothece sp. SIO1E1]
MSACEALSFEASPNPSESHLDPLNSPYPLPWGWLIGNQNRVATAGISLRSYYRTESLISPDGRYATYSRIQTQLFPDFTQSQVSSILFLEDLNSGDLHTITAASPLSKNRFNSNAASIPGSITILIPVAWSETGDRMLAREFESLFGTDLASDYAVIWDRRSNQTHTVTPTQIEYTHAVLMGWSQSSPQHVLFQAGQVGDERQSLWQVDQLGNTIAAIADDQPIVYGKTVTYTWTGPQAYR